jgi:ABC-type branched-subunit amino acid transport system ATPase component
MAQEPVPVDTRFLLADPDDAPDKLAPVAAPAELIPTGLDWSATLKAGGTGLVTVLTLITFLDYADSAALATLAPDIQRGLHLSDAGLGAIISVTALFFVLAGLPVALLAERARRTLVAGISATLAGIATLLTAGARTPGQLAVTRFATGAGQSSILPVHYALLADGYPVASRVRVLGLHSLAPTVAALVTPAIAGGIAGVASWRTVFVVLAVPSVLLGLGTLLLREPSRGGPERAALVVEAGPGRASAPAALGPALTRLQAIATFRRLLAGTAVLGFVIVALGPYLSVLLDRRFHLGTVARGIDLSLTELGSLAGVVIGAVLTERRSATDPQAAIRLFAGSTAAFGLVLPIAVYLPSLPAVLVAVSLARFLLALGTVALYTVIAGVLPPALRSIGFAVLGLSLLLGGGFLGSTVVGAISDAHGTAFALAITCGPAAVVAGILGRRAADTLGADLAAIAAEVRDEQEQLTSTDGPLLRVRGVDLSYGAFQVLNGVDLDVHEGEILALLGTNGAGKSTLLRALSGLSPVDRGSIRFEGRDLTLADPVERVRAGIIQVAGGKAVFASLTVLENLLVGAHTFAWDRARVRRRIEAGLVRVPALADKLDQRAGTLSGGEQQLLALAKAVLLEPRLLLIDELSLGLSPVLVEQALDLVSDLRDEGTTIVLVEQSLTIALSVADRAVFLEKGTVQFDGPAEGLLERDDLVRAVFLGGTRA